MNWVRVESSKSKKGVFVALIDNDEKMLGFVETSDRGIQVNGFLSQPYIDVEVHNEARSLLALQFLDMASESGTNILFLF